MGLECQHPPVVVTKRGPSVVREVDSDLKQEGSPTPTSYHSNPKEGPSQLVARAVKEANSDLN